MKQEKRSIVVVDGSASFIFYTAMMLKNLDYVVQSATTAEDALSLIARLAPAVVITDTALPGTSGLELIKRIKNSDSLGFIPVLVHSSLADPDIKDDCMLAGCTAFFSKPAPPEVLFEAIQSATEATPRHHIRVRTSIRARVGARPSERTEEVTQLSEGGLYLKTLQPAPVGTVVPLTLLMRNRDIRVQAVVLYSSQKAGGNEVPGMGMKFTDLNPADLTYLREFIRQDVLSTISHD
jgi:CheY-like chemotaxis protein/Tfp pilus assembly protein PilZ